MKVNLPEALRDLEEPQIDVVCAFAETLQSEHASPALAAPEFIRKRLSTSSGQSIVFPERRMS